MKHYSSFILVFFLSLQFVSQEKELKGLFKTDFSFLGLGISYEIPLSNKFTVDLSTGIGAGYRAISGLEAIWVINKTPAAYFKSEFKYIYNREKRFKEDKNNDNNSGNYWAFQSKYITRRFSEENFNKSSYVLLNEIHWGLQRSLGGSWLFNTHFGIGYARDFTFSTGSLYPAIGLKFTYIIL